MRLRDTHPRDAALVKDAELARLAASGDKGAFTEVVRRSDRTLYRVAHNILKDDVAARDAVQNSYLQAYRALAEFRADSSLLTWLVRIVINQSRSQLHGAQRRAEIFVRASEDGHESVDQDRSGEPDGAEEASRQPDTMAFRSQVRRLIEAQIDQLPEAFRTVFVLRAIEEMTVDEVAASLGLPPTTVRTRFFRARALLRESLAREIDLSLETVFGFAGDRCNRITSRVLEKLRQEHMAACTVHRGKDGVAGKCSSPSTKGGSPEPGHARFALLRSLGTKVAHGYRDIAFLLRPRRHIAQGDRFKFGWVDKSMQSTTYQLEGSSMKRQPECGQGLRKASGFHYFASVGRFMKARWRGLSLIGTGLLSAMVVSVIATSASAHSDPLGQQSTIVGDSAAAMPDRPMDATPVERKTAAYAARMLVEGRSVFRYDTFGDQAFWGGELGLNRTIAGDKNGGIGPGLSPATALALGLKVDRDALPARLLAALRAGKVNLNDPAVTLTLLRLNAVVGVKGFFDLAGNLTSVGITCAVCHSTVDDSFAPGIGRRLDGWANQDLNVGDIIGFAPNLQPIADELGVDQMTVRKVLTSWGPGMFNAELNLDGKAFKPDGTPYVTRIPAAYGHLGEDEHTWTAGFGDVTYWNAYVANLEMHGIGNFNDSRFDDPLQFPIAARTGQGHVRHMEDLITPKLAALQFYQLSLPAPKPPQGSFDPAAAERGKVVFNGQGDCAGCHMPTQFTDAGHNVHAAQELCIDNLQGARGPSGGGYVTPQLAGLWSRSKRGFYHDGRFPTLLAVIQHYDTCMKLSLSSGQESDLVQYLKSL